MLKPVATLGAPTPLDQNFNFECSPIEKINCEAKHNVRYENESKAALLSHGTDSFAYRIKALKNAKKSIYIQALIFTADESGVYIAELLKKKKKEGLEVKVIVDAVSNIGNWHTQWMYFDMQQHGIDIEGYEAMWLQWINELSKTDPMAVNKRFHEKLWIIDAGNKDAIAVMGGLNIANEYFRLGPDQKHIWRDQDIALQGDIIDDLNRTFELNFKYFKEAKKRKTDIFNTDTYWKFYREIIKHVGSFPVDKVKKIPLFEKFSLKTTDTVESRISSILNRRLELEFHPIKARFLHNRPRFDESYILQTYLSMIEAVALSSKTDKSIVIENAYFIPSREMIEALKAAVRNGVEVKIITNSIDTNDLPQLATVSRRLYKYLLEVNHEDTSEGYGKMEIYEWRGDKHEESTLHSKYAIFNDDVAIIGSYNLDPRSELLNSESAIIIESPELIKTLSDITLKNDLSKCELIPWDKAQTFHNPKDLDKQIKLIFAMPLKNWF